MNAELVEFILEKVAGEPLEKRAQLYRLIVLSCSDQDLTASVRALADECDEIERRHRQLVLDFKRRSL